MTTKTITIRYNGKLKKIKVFFTFRFQKKNYAYVSFDEANTMLRVVRIKYSPSEGVESDGVVTDDAVLRAAEAVCGQICSSQAVLLNGEHYCVTQNQDGAYEIRIAGKLRRLSRASRFVSAVLGLLISFIISGGILYFYFRSPNDWICLMSSPKSPFIIGAVSFAVCCAIQAAICIYQRKKGKGSGAGFYEAMLAPQIIALGFSLIARRGTRVCCLLALGLFVAGFIFMLFRIRKMHGRAARSRALDRLLKSSKTVALYACLGLMALSIAVGYLAPYRRNQSTGLIQNHIIARQYEAACKNLEQSAFRSLDQEEKIEMFQAIVDYEAMTNHTPSAKLIPEDLNTWLDSGKTYASYYDDYNVIYLDKRLSLSNPVDALDSVLHEYRHAVQHCVASGRTKKTAAESELAEAFRENIENYVSAQFSGYDKYSSQLLEVDARAWAAKRLNDYLAYVSKEDLESSDVFNNENNNEFLLKTFKSNDCWDYAVSHPYDNGEDHTADFISLGRYVGPGNVEQVTVPDEIDGLPVKSLGSELFRYAQHLQTVTIPATVTEISDIAFEGCENLSVKVDAKNGAFRITDGAFLVSLKDNVLLWVDKKATGAVTIPKEITAVAWYAFSSCKGITDIFVEAGNEDYASFNGLLYNKKNNAVVLCPEGKAGVVELADGCSIIRRETFSNCELVTDVIIPDSVEEIESYAFTGCASLLRLTVPAVKSISSYAFIGLENLERLSISKDSVFYTGRIESANCLRLINPKLTDVFYDGTKAEWEDLEVIYNRDYFSLIKTIQVITIHCADGEVIETLKQGQ